VAYFLSTKTKLYKIVFFLYDLRGMNGEGQFCWWMKLEFIISRKSTDEQELNSQYL